MSEHTLLQAFLVFDIFLAGVVAAEAIRHALAHYRPHKHDAEHARPDGVHLPPAMREHLMEEAQANFEAVLASTTRDLQKDLAATSEQIKAHVEKLEAEATSKELEHYKAVIADLQDKTKTNSEGLDKELTAQKAEMRAKLTAEMEVEKKKLLEAIDSKLADAVASFLSETLQHEVDLGAQGAYLSKMLEEHKTDFAREVAGGQ
jgi:uncharacterized protein YaaR (DUF327 family)